MNVIQPMMRSRNCEDARTGSHAIKAIAARKVSHEISNLITRWRYMPPDRNIMLFAGAPFARFHLKLGMIHFDDEYFIRCIFIEFPVKPLNEFGGRWFGQFAAGSHAVDFGLHPYVRCRFKLQISAAFIFIEFAGERSLYVAGACVMALNEVAVVAVHQPYDAREMGSGCGMEPCAQDRCGRRKFGDNISNLLRRLLEACWFNPRRRFNKIFGRCHILVLACK